MGLLFGSPIQMVITFIILSSIINYFILKCNSLILENIKKVNGLKNILFGIEVTLIGILIFYLAFKYTFTSMLWSIVVFFIPVYIITTGFTLSLIGYISKDK